LGSIAAYEEGGVDLPEDSRGGLDDVLDPFLGDESPEGVDDSMTFWYVKIPLGGWRKPERA
jgi:hypothetical protein